MSAFYDQASLVVVPSGYKSGKIYAQKPLTTDGQLTFTRASTATRVNASGLIETVSSGVPRLDYQGSTCPKILLEKQSTNILNYSQEFDNAWWSKYLLTVTANAVTSPDGTQNADTLVSASSSTSSVYNAVVITGTYTFSAYFKAGTSSSSFIDLPTGGGANFNLANQTYETFGTVASATITAAGNGWYRCSVTATVSSTPYVALGINGGVGTTLHAWGAMLEASAYMTSYIPTTSAAVTRLADAASKTGISSLIGQTEGVAYIECNIKAIGELSRLVFISDGTLNNFINIYVDSDNKIYATTRLSASTVSLFVSNTLTAGTYKIAYAYKSNDFVLYINGVAISGSSSASIPATSRIEIGSRLTTSSYFNSFVNQALLFKTRLTNAQLAELTTL